MALVRGQPPLALPSPLPQAGEGEKPAPRLTVLLSFQVQAITGQYKNRSCPRLPCNDLRMFHI
jgi:hypothetical protein